mmetsp:Transcript_56904/g.135375  ORF Transcript_56904/g.135375 Transcript_56904/m.135375 type:complete len:251 (+) Transcript_56904:727-1479(+)
MHHLEVVWMRPIISRHRFVHVEAEHGEGALALRAAVLSICLHARSHLQTGGPLAILELVSLTLVPEHLLALCEFHSPALTAALAAAPAVAACSAGRRLHAARLHAAAGTTSASQDKPWSGSGLRSICQVVRGYPPRCPRVTGLTAGAPPLMHAGGVANEVWGLCARQAGEIGLGWGRLQVLAVGLQHQRLLERLEIEGHPRVISRSVTSCGVWRNRRVQLILNSQHYLFHGLEAGEDVGKNLGFSRNATF